MVDFLSSRRLVIMQGEHVVQTEDWTDNTTEMLEKGLHRLLFLRDFHCVSEG